MSERNYFACRNSEELVVSCRLPRPSEIYLGAAWNVLEGILGRLGAAWKCLRGHLRRLWSVLGCRKAFRKPPGRCGGRVRGFLSVQDDGLPVSQGLHTLIKLFSTYFFIYFFNSFFYLFLYSLIKKIIRSKRRNMGVSILLIPRNS